MTNFFKMALMGIFAVGAFTACGSDDDDSNPNPGGGGGDDTSKTPSIELTGAQTSGSESSSLTFKLKLTDAQSAKYLMAATDDLQSAMGSATLEELIASEGESLNSSQLQNALGQGLDLVFQQLEPNTEYTCAIYAANGDKSAVKSAVATTANGGGGSVNPGTGSDAYNAWIGTWNVTSASSLVGNDPLNFTVTIEQLEADSSYAVLGWGISVVAVEQPVGALFNPEDGKLYFVSGQEFGTIDNQGMQMMVTYMGVCGYNGGWTVVSGEYNGLIGTMGEDGNSATFEGQELELQNGLKVPVYTFDFFAVEVGGTQVGVYNPAPGFTSEDYPMPPYTLTKSGSVGAGKALRTFFAAPQVKKAGYPMPMLSAEVRSMLVAK